MFWMPTPSVEIERFLSVANVLILQRLLRLFE